MQSILSLLFAIACLSPAFGDVIDLTTGGTFSASDTVLTFTDADHGIAGFTLTVTALHGGALANGTPGPVPLTPGDVVTQTPNIGLGNLSDAFLGVSKPLNGTGAMVPGERLRFNFNPGQQVESITLRTTTGALYQVDVVGGSVVSGLINQDPFLVAVNQFATQMDVITFGAEFFVQSISIAIPEPATTSLLLLGSALLLGVGLVRKKV